jgi:hypothetical protein
MAIKAGRDGQVKMGVDDATAVTVISLNKFTISLATDKIEVTCFSDTNKVYVPGMRDISGTIGGFYNSAELTIIEATDDDVPTWLVLLPHASEATMKFSGLAYVDASIDTEVNGAPAMTGNFMAAGPWTIPGTP